MNFSPRSEDNNAARMHIIAEIMNAILKEGINAFANVEGNQVVPVKVFNVE